MLDIIKSSYFHHILFSFMDMCTKLKIFQHNKKWQNNLQFTLIDYKRYSGKYSIYEGKDQIKIYNAYRDRNELLYEGGFSNGKKNGKGKEYDEEGFKYEGEFLNGKRHGKGKEYEGNNQIIFEGEYLNGKRWNGKGYNGDGFLLYELKEGKGYVRDYYRGHLIYEGEYLNGERNGKGKEYKAHVDYLVYDGEYLNGKRHGKAKEYFECFLVFEGEYLNGKRWNGKINTNIEGKTYEIKNGKGLFLDFNKNNFDYFEGNYVNGEKNGKGKYYYGFEGEFVNDKKNGKGKVMSRGYVIGCHVVFEGNYINDHYLNGKEYELSNGKLRYEGEYVYDLFWTGKEYDRNGNIINEYKDGAGIIKEPDYLFGGSKFEGEYANGRRNGKGKEYYYGQIYYEGEYLNGEKNGKGKLYNKDDGSVYEGEFLRGKKNGKGKLIDKDGNLLFEGECLDGKEWNGKKYDGKGNVIYEIKDGCYPGQEEKNKPKEEKKDFYENGQIKFDGVYFRDEKWTGKGYDINGNLEYEIINGNGKRIDRNDKGQILLEAECLNGLKHGKVKTYFRNGQLAFDGDYLYGKKNGKGKEYDYEGNLFYEGEYLNGKRCGKGIEYDKNGKVKHEGEFINDQKLINHIIFEKGELLFRLD